MLSSTTHDKYKIKFLIDDEYKNLLDKKWYASFNRGKFNYFINITQDNNKEKQL